ncbi:M24 family metallopeptidase [Risungbinella massiliensis]|uniref:M24 family metallopeptidase n=1 Tax=Risungbinella massiliensis TaxID=1329796 RepID=UPI0005CB9172|nr:Xaa-Pro peptidase family protein [Risungbinella massiliensis]
MEQRMNQLAKRLQMEGVDFAFLTSPYSIFYYTNYYTDPHERLVALYLHQNGTKVLICPAMEVEQVRSVGWEEAILAYDDVQNPWKMFQESYITPLSSHTLKIAVEKEHLTFARLEQLQEFLADATFVGAEPAVLAQRLVKDEIEVQKMREAARMADYAIEEAIKMLKTGITELEMVAKIEMLMKMQGAEQMSFPTTVLFGEKSAMPHGKPGKRKLQEGDIVLFDLGVVLNGYCSDITRTVAYGSITDKQKEIYLTVLEGQLAALEVSRPGTVMREVDLAARSVITNAGYGDYFMHRVGHGLGIDVHEAPSLHSENTDLLVQGMTFTIEPGIYIPNVGGVRIEDDVLITQNGYETLTKYPKELQVIPVSR